MIQKNSGHQIRSPLESGRNFGDQSRAVAQCHPVLVDKRKEDISNQRERYREIENKRFLKGYECSERSGGSFAKEVSDTSMS